MKKSASLAALVVALPVSFAAAADLPSRKEPAIAPIVVPSWTGFHVGLNAGGTWGAGGATNMSTWTAVLANSGRTAADQRLNYTDALYDWRYRVLWA